jgi:hypothetical protein
MVEKLSSVSKLGWGSESTMKRWCFEREGRRRESEGRGRKSRRERISM